ncbi:hypothetical protein [Pedobacter sp. L105]|nr:hypothetical protein [Pedobacter sp. L105]
MENKTAENTERPLTTDPFLVNTIVEILTSEIEGINKFLNQATLLEND